MLLLELSVTLQPSQWGSLRVAAATTKTVLARFSIRDEPNLDFGFPNGGFLPRMAETGDVLLSVRAPVGDLNVAYERCCIGRGLGAIHSKTGHSSFVLYTMFALRSQLDVFNGEGTVFGSINRDALNAIPIDIPPVTEIDQFEAVAHPIDELIRANYEENCRLEAIRDSLLPKLMSGEIDVSAVNL